MIRCHHAIIAAVVAALWTLTCQPVVCADPLRELQNELAGYLAHPSLAGATVGFEARSLTAGETLMVRNANRAFLPASNQKLVTVATAFELLGGEHQCNVALAGPDGDRSLTAVARRILKPSDNDLAETLLVYLPVATGRRDLSPEALAAETWAERGLFVGDMNWQDGSGLSRRDLMTPAFTTRLLGWMLRESRWSAEFLDALPEAGVDGTLRWRMRGTAAQSRVRAKTGTLTGVSALSGYAISADGEVIVFSIMMNDFTCPVSRMRRLQDHICIALAQFSRAEEGP